MAAKLNTTKRIGGTGAGIHKCASPTIMNGGAGNTGNYDGVKRRGGKSPMTGSGYGTARGIGGGAKTTTGGTRSGQDSDGY